MKNYSIILTAVLSLSLLACGSESSTTKKTTGGEKIPPVVNAALAGAGAGDDAVKNFILGEEDAGTDITAAPKYGNLDTDGNFVEAEDATDQKQTPLLRIGDKVYHNINADAKILLEKDETNVLYLNDEAPNTKAADLKTALAGVNDITYEGIANAEWTNIDTDIEKVRYFKEKTAGSASKPIFGKVALAVAESAEGTVEVKVDNTGKATITPTGIGNSDSSASFNWDTSNIDDLEETVLTDLKTVTAMNVWKPEKAPVIEISAAGAISDDDVYTLGTLADAPHVLFIGEGADSQVGGLITLGYTIAETITDGSSTDDDFNAVVLYESSAWKIGDVAQDKTIKAGLYHDGTSTPALEGKLKLAFVSTSAEAAE